MKHGAVTAFVRWFFWESGAPRRSACRPWPWAGCGSLSRRRGHGPKPSTPAEAVIVPANGSLPVGDAASGIELTQRGVH
jgi:hypothetical protein